MATRTTAWIAGLTLIGSTLSLSAMEDNGPFDIYNPLGVYVGAGLGRSQLNNTQFDEYGDYFHHLDGQPLGWEAYAGIRPIPFLGAEAEYIDFGHSHQFGGPSYYVNGFDQQYGGGDTHDQAAAIFAVGYLPVPIPWIDVFGKLGWAQMWQHDNYSAVYGNGAGAVYDQVSQTTHPNGVAYGGGVQFKFPLTGIGVRAQYERISGDHAYGGGWNDPALWSVGVNWTF